MNVDAGVSLNRPRAAHREFVDNNTNLTLAAELALRAPAFTGQATVTWTDPAGLQHEQLADAALSDRELYLARTSRRGNRYPRQRNYHGYYFFAQTRTHIWFESLLERSRLASIDHASDVVAIASQPMKLVFDDGSEHFPDLFALHASLRQVLYDIKPLERISEKYLEQFAKTKAMCDRIGWGYSVLTELSPVEKANLDWLRNFKLPGHHPGAEALARLLPALPLPLGSAATLLFPTSPAEGRSALSHLAWTREVHIDTTVLLSDATLVEAPRA